jgi:hypothetical protein
MSVKFVALTVLALTGAVVMASEPAFPAGGVRGLPGGRIAAPLMVHRNARTGFLRAFAHSPSVRAFDRARARFGIPPSPHGFATTTPLRPLAHLTRRYHGIYRAGWNFPLTIGDYADDPGFIGAPYDPAEAIPVYGPAPAADPADLVPPWAQPWAPVTSRITNATEENRDACRAERVTVPAADGERTITVVRC